MMILKAILWFISIFLSLYMFLEYKLNDEAHSIHMALLSMAITGLILIYFK